MNPKSQSFHLKCNPNYLQKHFRTYSTMDKLTLWWFSWPQTTSHSSTTKKKSYLDSYNVAWTMCVLCAENAKSNRPKLAQWQGLVNQGSVLFYLNYAKMGAKW